MQILRSLIEFLKRCLELKRILLISPELLVALFIWLARERYPGWFAAVAAAFRTKDQLPAYIGYLPFALVIGNYFLGQQLLHPGSSDGNKTLYQWPLYWALEVRVYISIAVSTLCAGASLLFYVNYPPLDDPSSGVLILASVVVSTTSVATLFLAKTQLRRLLTLYK